MMTLSPKLKIILHDLCAIIIAWNAALWVRFNFEIPPALYLQANLLALPIVIAVQGLVARQFKLYRGLWRFASLPDLWNIIRAAILGALAIAIILFVINRLEAIPRSTLVLYPFFLIFLLGGPRLTYRLWKDHSLRMENLSADGERVIVIGAGTAGEAVVRDMLRSSGYVPIGFIDDKASLLKSRIHGVPVLGPLRDLGPLADRHAADALIIAVPSASSEQMRNIVEACERSGRPFRTLPKLRDIVTGRAGVHELREVSIDDLLGRDKVQLDWAAIQSALVGRAVLVTGGGGSIGSELCRQIAGLGPARLVVIDHSEFNLYNIEREIASRYPHVNATFVLGDVCDAHGVDRLFEACRPHVVFHAAAFKHVPILESNVREAARNNVLGSATVISAASRHGCESFVLISSDKAVRPSSVMGASKRFAELLCDAENQRSSTRYITVRFGNVLDSAGSVVPLFREQIAAGGPVTVTHPEARRFFMTIPEACQLILEASAAGAGGEIYVLDMGEPMQISYLAEQMIRLSGKKPEEDVRIVFTGLRPGEKLSEELFHDHESVLPTDHDKLLLAKQGTLDVGVVRDTLARLREGVDAGDDEVLRTVLLEVVPALGLEEHHKDASGLGNIVQLPRS